MIERYFVKGVNFNWTPPPTISPPAMDGTNVSSGINPGPAMTYAGLSTEIVYGPMPKPLHLIYAKTNAPATHGLIAGINIPYQWFNYVLGRTAHKRIGAVDSLTGFMSGCRICTWTDGGIRRVGHIGTVESSPKTAPPNSTVKATFRGMINGIGAGAALTGFNPALAWSFNDIKSVCKEAGTNWANLAGNSKIMSLVTTANQFYAVLMIKSATTPNLWTCGGKKHVTAKTQAAQLLDLA